MLYIKVKRLLDLFFSLLALIVLSPILLFIIIGIKIDSSGPIFFKQKRVGIHKSYFNILKFRTMKIDAPKDIPTHMFENPDQYITKMGKFLRKTSLDELPQLYNILVGEMSFIGPRPALWNQYDLVEERDKYKANAILPGLTGWAQINGRDELEISVKARYDGIYVNKMTLWFDMHCIIRTILSVIRGLGVVEGRNGNIEHIVNYTENVDKQKDLNTLDTVLDSDLNIKKVLITGANSYIGISVDKWLTRYPHKYKVDTIDMIDNSWKNMDFSCYDIIFHVAGIAHADFGKITSKQKELYYHVNYLLAVDVAKKAKIEGTKQFIFMSSSIIYGDSAGINQKKIITKGTTPQPANCYGDSKLQADKAIREFDSNSFKVVILRPPMIYGKGSKGNYPNLANLANILPIFPDIDNERSMLHIDNFCEFIKLMIDNKESGIFFPQNSEYVKTSDLVKLVAKAHGKKIMTTKMFNPIIRAISKMPGKLGVLSNKAFGNVVYTKSMSEYSGGEYRLRGLEESISLTER